MAKLLETMRVAVELAHKSNAPVDVCRYLRLAEERLLISHIHSYAAERTFGASQETQGKDADEFELLAFELIEAARADLAKQKKNSRS